MKSSLPQSTERKTEMDIDDEEPSTSSAGKFVLLKTPKISEGSNDGSEKVKKKKRGIIYVSSIPKHMNITIAKEILGQYADIGRVFFEPQKMPEDKNKNNKKRRKSRYFTEGWIEFESKKAAKQIAAQLNNTPISNRKGSKFFGILWNLKYLQRFKWVHLTERLTYEREVHKQKMRAELSLAKREANFLQENIDKSERLKPGFHVRFDHRINPREGCNIEMSSA